MAKLATATDSKSVVRKDLRVRLPLSAFQIFPLLTFILLLDKLFKEPIKAGITHFFVFPKLHEAVKRKESIMQDPLCQGKGCQEMARLSIIVYCRLHSFRSFTCHECKNEVERNLMTEGERFGLNRVVISQIR